jgi:pimeloyl-ACP methyl ester carboxylesterase
MPKCFRASVMVVVLLVGGLGSGCTSLISKEIVLAPNAGRTARQVGDASEATLEDQFIAKQVRVAVGPPAASLSAWIVEAWSVTVDARLHERAGDVADDDPDFDREIQQAYNRARGERVELTLLNGAMLEPMAHTDATGNLKVHFQFGMLTAWKGHPSTQPAAGVAAVPAAVEQRAPKGTIFVLHGIGDRKDKVPYLMWARILAEAGYRAVLVDLRGHGRSTGRYMTYGVRESRDMKQLLDAFEEQGLVAGPVGVWGISYGAAVGIQWAAVDPRVRAVCAFEPFSTLRDAVRDFAPVVLGGWSFIAPAPVLRATTNAAAALAGFDPDDASPLTAITKTDAPVLLVHGTKDHHLPPYHSVRLHEAAPDHSELFLVEGDGHLTLWVRHLPVVRERVTAWFDETLGAGASPATRPSAPGAARQQVVSRD